MTAEGAAGAMCVEADALFACPADEAIVVSECADSGVCYAGAWSEHYESELVNGDSYLSFFIVEEKG